MESLIFSDEYYMRQALREAQRAYDQDEVPIGSVIVIENSIIARGYNQTQLLHDVTAHSEMISLTAASNHLGSKYLPQATIYITVEPCLMCAGALYWSKIGRIVYGARDEKNGYHKHFDQDKGTTPFHPKTRLTYGILEEECKALMQDFFRKKR